MDPPQSAASPDSDSPQAAAAREAHPIRRQLDENRWKNQKKRVAWEQAKEESIGICREFIGDFVKCTEGKTFSVIWSCRPHNNWMTTCMKTYMETKDREVALAAGQTIKDKFLASQQ